MEELIRLLETPVSAPALFAALLTHPDMPRSWIVLSKGEDGRAFCEMPAYYKFEPAFSPPPSPNQYMGAYVGYTRSRKLTDLINFYGS